MKYSIHHTNGRIRVKSKAFYGNSSHASLFRGKLHEQSGILKTRHNKYAASITIYYDPSLLDSDKLIDCINNQDCLSCEKSVNYAKKLPQKHASSMSKSGSAIASKAGQIAFGVLLEKGVRYSMKSVLGV